ncbi:MAG TPA: XRE family transcriptional regulator [Micromonosporaceae bacterium]|nr:XRE family transcriptional regulator [Micromonosporaceae bacterium]
MGQTPREIQPAGSPLLYFGAEVRRLRLQRGWSAGELGSAVLTSMDLVRRIELGERYPTQQFVDRCDEVFDRGGFLRRMWPLLERERRLRLVRETANDGAAYNSRLADRPVLDWLLETQPESRSRPTPSAPDVADFGKQLQHIRQLDHQHGAGAAYPQVVGFMDRHLAQLVSCSPRTAIGSLELAGYSAVDVGADGAAQLHYVNALEVATRSGDHLYAGYLTGVSLAHLALHCGDPRQAQRLAQAAMRGTERNATPALRSAFHAVLARTYARQGDRAETIDHLQLAEREATRSRPLDEPEIISYFGSADLADERAHCFFDLGLEADAQREARDAIGQVSPSRVRRLAIDYSLLAASLARSGAVEEACAMGRAAVDHAAATRSFRSTHRIMLMLAELHAFADHGPVRDLVDYVQASLPAVPIILR